MDGVGGVDGLRSANAVAAAPDGLHVYATGSGDDAVTAFARDAASGELTFVETLIDGIDGVDGLDSPRDVVVSPDGDHVYTASGLGGDFDNAIAVFARDELSGELTFVEALFDGAGGLDSLDGLAAVAVSPDGLNVYAAAGSSDNALTVFSRDAMTGELTFVEALFDGVGGVDGLNGVNSLVLTADGRHLYTLATGSPAAVALFGRDTTSGELTFVEVQTHGTGGVFGLRGPQDLALGLGDSYLFATGNNSVTVFARDPATGELTFVEAQFQGDPPNQGLDDIMALTAAPDGHHVYTASMGDDALVGFRTALIFADGFESGDTSRW